MISISFGLKTSMLWNLSSDSRLSYSAYVWELDDSQMLNYW